MNRHGKTGNGLVHLDETVHLPFQFSIFYILIEQRVNLYSTALRVTGLVQPTHATEADALKLKW